MGKTVFIKFYAPWCMHCKAMKEDWDKLMEEYSDHDTTYVGEVDCTDKKYGGAKLCQLHEVQGYPTIKYGNPNKLIDYQGDRGYAKLLNFAKTLKPICSYAHQKYCEKGEVERMKKFESLGFDDLSKLIKEKQDEIKNTEETFENEVYKLKEEYRILLEEKDNKVQEIKDNGLDRMKEIKKILKEKENIQDDDDDEEDDDDDDDDEYDEDYEEDENPRGRRNPRDRPNRHEDEEEGPYDVEIEGDYDDDEAFENEDDEDGEMRVVYELVDEYDDDGEVW